MWKMSAAKGGAWASVAHRQVASHRLRLQPNKGGHREQ